MTFFKDQQFWTLSDGTKVSTWLAGTNMAPDYGNQHTIRDNSTIQGHIKSAGATVMRCAIPPTDSNNNTTPDAYIDKTYNACVASGCIMMLILIHDNAAWNKHVVTYLGSKCNIYEFGNEPDLYPSSNDASGHPANSPQAYYYWWSNNIPNLRKVNSNALFIGPVLGVFDNLNSFVKPWLTSCKNAGGAMIPDGISYHVYPCTGTQSQSTCAPKAGNYSNCFGQVDSLVNSVLGYTLPQCMTEWNIDANADSTHNPYITDSGFVGTWTTKAMNNMAKAGFAMACQFDAGSGAGAGVLDLVSISPPYDPQIQYQPFANVISNWSGGSSGGGGSGASWSPYGVTIATFNTSVFYDGTSKNSQLLKDLQHLKIGHVRFQQDMDIIQSKDGASYDWTALDDMIGFCNANGFTVSYPMRSSGGSWIRSSPKGQLINPSQTDHTTCNNTWPNDNMYQASPDVAATFADALTKRYNGKTVANAYKSGTYLKLDGLEIGNEEYDLPSDCHASTGGAYVCMGTSFAGFECKMAKWWINVAKQVIPVAKKNIPDLRIGQWGMFGGNIKLRQQILTDIYNAKDANGNPLYQSIDFFNFHFYKGGDPQVDNGTLDVSLPNTITKLGNIISSFGDNKKIRVTEIGWSNATVEDHYGISSTGDPDPNTEATYYQSAMKDMHGSGIVEGFDFFTFGYNVSSGTNVKEGKTLNQPVPNPPSSWPPQGGYWPAADSIRNYATSYPSWGSTTTQTKRDLSMRARIFSPTSNQDLAMRARVKALVAQQQRQDLAMLAALAGGIVISDTFQRPPQPGWGTASDGEEWVQAGGSATPSIVYRS